MPEGSYLMSYLRTTTTSIRVAKPGPAGQKAEYAHGREPQVPAQVINTALN